MPNTITIELCAEDRARIDKLLESVRELDVTMSAASDIFSISTKDAKPADKPESTAPVTEPVPEAAEQPRPADKPEEPASYTKADVQRLVTELCGKGSDTKAKVKEIVNRYGRNVSSIPEDKYGEAMAALQELRYETDAAAFEAATGQACPF